MGSEDKKLAILSLLREESKPISLNELLEKFGKDFSARTLRRWLTEMIQNGTVIRLGERRGAKYQANREPQESSECFSSESQQVLELIKRPLSKRSPITYEIDWIDAYKPNQTFYIPLEVRDQLKQLGERSKNQEPAGTYAHQIFNRLLIDLSYNSSRLEGNTYSLLETKRLLLEGSGAEGKLDEEKIMILNHKEAIRYLVDHAPKLEVSTKTICTIHYLLSDGLVETQYSGKVRDHGVHIGGSTYIPLENPKTIELQLKHISEKAKLIKNPFEQSLFLLIHMSYLQAFSDVNKRTARLSANIPLIKNNLVPLSFNDIEQTDYMSAIISLYELQNIHPMLDLYTFSYKRTCAMYDSTVKAIGFDEVRVRYRQERRTLIRHIILQKIVGKEIKKFITSESKKFVNNEDRDAFLEDTIEDLKEIDDSRIIGLGITPKQLANWIKISSKNPFS